MENNKNLFINKINSRFDEFFPVLVFYFIFTFLFLLGLYMHGFSSKFSDVLIITLLQVVIYSMIINGIIAISLPYITKNQLIFSNIHLIFILYYILVFLLLEHLDSFSPNMRFILSLLLAFFMVSAIIYITNERYFNQQIWSMAVYFSFTYMFDIKNIKYISLLFLLVLIIRIYFKAQQIYFKKVIEVIEFINPDIGKFDTKKLTTRYAVLSIVFWCYIYYLLIDRPGRDFQKNFFAFLFLGFFLPNFFVIIQAITNNGYVFVFAIFFYFSLNMVLQLAQLHLDNLDSESFNKIDNAFEELLESFNLQKTWGGPLRNSWRNVKQVAKETVANNRFYGSGGPKRWGVAIGGVAGFSTTVYFADKHQKNAEKANEIAEKANEISKQASEIAKQANEIAKQAVQSQNQNNELLIESNLINKALLEAQLEGNKYSKSQAEEAIRYNNANITDSD